MLRLPFTSRVLGPYATGKLKDGLVEQTVRSEKHAKDYLGHEGEIAEVTLDNAPQYFARIVGVTALVSMSSLDGHDAHLGGFPDLDEFHAAAARAGFRFKPLDEYFVRKIRFRRVFTSDMREQFR